MIPEVGNDKNVAAERNFLLQRNRAQLAVDGRFVVSHHSVEVNHGLARGALAYVSASSWAGSAGQDVLATSVRGRNARA